jgi:ABC-type multidrug transport system fused ATPase/permease subunit
MTERLRAGAPRGPGRLRAWPGLRKLDVLFGTAVREAPGLTAACTATALAAGVLGVVYPVAFRIIVDGASSHHGRAVVLGVLLVAASFAASWGARLVGAMMGSRLTDRANLFLGTRIGALVNEAPFLEHFDRPEYLAEIDNLRAQRRTLAGSPRQILSLAQSALQVALVVVLLAAIYPPVLVVPLLAVLPGLADRHAARIQKSSDDDLADKRRLLGELFNLASTAAPARELRTFGITNAVVEHHSRLCDEVNARSLRAARRSALWEAFGWAGYAAGFAAGVIVLVLRAAHGHGSPGDVVEAVSLVRRSQRQLGSATDTAGSFATAAVTAGRLLWLEDYAAGMPAPGRTSVPGALSAGIRFDDVDFVYPGRSKPTLSGLRLSLAAGSTVAVVGENGAGKTTLVKLLTGMYRPTRGTISVDGTDLAHLDPAAWRQATTGAFQDFVRFNMTLGDGVGVGDLPRVDDQAALGLALVQAGAASLVAELPEGLGTVLGPYIGGQSLSGGQWQRLALARGLMRQAPLVVVLDEPTASLDAPTEAAIFSRYRDAARRLGQANGAITVLVSHRFSTVHMADQIVVMDNGRVVQTGDHATLLAEPGLYAELFNLQARGYATS